MCTCTIVSMFQYITYIQLGMYNLLSRIPSIYFFMLLDWPLHFTFGTDRHRFWFSTCHTRHAGVVGNMSQVTRSMFATWAFAVFLRRQYVSFAFLQDLFFPLTEQPQFRCLSFIFSLSFSFFRGHVIHGHGDQ